MEDAAAGVVDAEAAEEGVAAQAIRVQTGLRVGGRWMSRIFRRGVRCLCRRRVLRSKVVVRMTMRMRVVGEDGVVRQGLSLE